MAVIGKYGWIEVSINQRRMAVGSGGKRHEGRLKSKVRREK